MPDLMKQIMQMADDAVAASRDRGGGLLDFSEQSIEIVEEMLDEAARFIETLNPGQQAGLVQQMSCYLMEVGRRTYGGSYYWHDGRDKPLLVVGEPVFRIAMLPWDHVQNRLHGDPAENIPFYYSGFRKRVRHAEPGEDVLLV